MRNFPQFLVLSIIFFAIPMYSTSQDVNQGELDKSSKPQKFYSPETELVNKAKVADAYPFISGDGLRLYFTSNREGGHGRFFISTRKTVADPFGEPVVLSKNITDGYYAGSLTADELTLCMVKSGKIYLSTRKDLQAEFGVPLAVTGIPEGYHFGPAISPDGKEIIVMQGLNKNETVKIYKKIAEGVTAGIFVDAGEMPIPGSADPGPGQFSKDGLSYYFSFTNEKNEVSIWRYTRLAITNKFVDLEELPLKINALQRNFQPTVNADASILIYTTSQNNVWDEDDLVVVNDPKKVLSAPEQFTSVLKNNANTVEVMTKVMTPQIRTFPNPFQSNIILEMNLEPGQGTYFTLYDLNGKMIKQQLIVNMKTTIQLDNLPSATYIYQVIDNKKKLISSGKLVKG